MSLKSSLRMIQAYRRRYNAVYGYGFGPYDRRVLNESPIAYWKLAESSGTTAVCEIDSNQNGTYSSDVSGWPPGEGINDGTGNTAPFFDGSNDYVNIVTATLQGAFDGTEGTAMLWERVANSGVWTDGVVRIGLSLWASDNDQVQLSKVDNNNELWYRRYGNAILEDMRVYGISTTEWYHHCITWSEANDRAIAYLNGNEIDTETDLGAWSGALNALATRIGALLVSGNHWHGWLQHVAIFDRELTCGQVARLGHV